MQLRCRQDRGRGVVREQRRNVQRHPAINAVGGIVDRPEQIRGLARIFQREFEEQRLARLAFAHHPADGVIVGAAALYGVIEGRGIRCQSRHRQLSNVAAERSAGQQCRADVVEPDALAEIVKLLCGIHVAFQSSINTLGRVAQG